MLQKDDFTAIGSTLRTYLPEKDTPYILDIDLDFFSTKNPFKNIYEHAHLYDKLVSVFKCERMASDDPAVSSSFWFYHPFRLACETLFAKLGYLKKIVGGNIHSLYGSPVAFTIEIIGNNSDETSRITHQGRC